MACLHSQSLSCDAAVRHADGVERGGYFSVGRFEAKLLLIDLVFPIGLHPYNQKTYVKLSKILHKGGGGGMQ